jgi:zinc protease
MGDIRRRVFLVALGVMMPGYLEAQASDTWRSRVNRVVKDTVLANGLTVIIAENHVVPLTTVKVSFRGGAAMQGPGEEGLAHLAEHYLFRTYGEDAAFASEVASLNGTYNGTTSEEEVNYYVTLPSKALEGGVRLMAKLVREPKLNDRALAAEKKVVVDELARDRSNGGSALRMELGSQIWAGDWFHKDVGGNAASISSIKLDRIRAMLATQYVPANAAVIISGDVNPSLAIAEVVRRFGDWSAQPAAANNPSMPSLPAVKTFAVSAPDVQMLTVAVQWLGPSVTTAPADAVAGEVFAEMLESALSPAMKRLVADGSFHSISAQSETLNGRGTFTFTGVISPDAAERALPSMRSEIEHLEGTDFLNDSLLVAAKKALAVRAEYHLESGITMGDLIGSMWATANLDYFRNYGDAIDKVTLPMVESFVKRYLHNQPYVAGALSPEAHLSRVRLAVATAFTRRTP